MVKKVNSLDHRTKSHPTKTEKFIGGGEFIITSVSHIITNSIYVGLVKHRKNTYQGHHSPIIEREVFDNVQEILGKNPQSQGKFHKFGPLKF